ncbi:MAG: hypothetical protein JNL98_07190 [Bryobacterales bacterium]|nr:hypothetical protein [Bryobacterales bacterium]
MNQPLNPAHIMQTGLGFWASKTLLSAIEMGVFTELSRHPEDLKTLQGRLGLHPRGARDFLDTLVALGFLLRTDGVYRNTPETDFFLDKHKPSYIGGILETKRMLMAKAYAALPEGGSSVVFEAIIDDDRSANAFGLMMSLNMLIETPGGFDYTGADCQQWMREAGFRETRVEHLTGPDSMVVGVK